VSRLGKLAEAATQRKRRKNAHRQHRVTGRAPGTGDAEQYDASRDYKPCLLLAAAVVERAKTDLTDPVRGGAAARFLHQVRNGGGPPWIQLALAAAQRESES
jgi:hypothetical protein